LTYALADQNIDASSSVLVGDRCHEIIAANDWVAFHRVSWGFGGRQELEDAQADVIVDSQEQLAQFVEARFLNHKTLER
jgi:phosphoglycolate phosphatase